MAIASNIAADDEFFLGESKELDFIIYAQGSTLADILAGSAVRENITGWQFRWTLREETRDPPFLTKTTPTQIIVTNPSAGELSVAINHVDTATKVPGKYFHSLARVDTGSESEISYGYLILKGPAI